MTLPTPDAQSPGLLSQHPQAPYATHSTPTTHSMPANPSRAPLPPASPKSSGSGTEYSGTIARERASNFAVHSWDLATGGLKTLTAKRELPPRPERRAPEQLPDTTAPPRSYMFLLVIVACIVIMLISGGIMLFIMLQP